MLNKIRNNFLAGVAIIFPLAITVVIVRYLVIKINSWILNPLMELLNLSPDYPPTLQAKRQFRFLFPWFPVLYMKIHF